MSETSKTAPIGRVDMMKQLKEVRREALQQQPGSADLPDVDENGIPFQKAVQVQPVPLCGPVDGLMKYPMWNGKLMRDVNGVAKPRIVMVVIDSCVNSGQGTAFYAATKGFKEVTEIPDTYAQFRDPYVKAIQEWKAAQEKKAALRAQLEEAGYIPPTRSGLTTTKTMGAVAGGIKIG